MSLRTRLIIAFLLLSVVPLTAVTLFSYISSVNAVENAAQRAASDDAADISRRMDVITADVGRRMDSIFDAGENQLHGVPTAGDMHDRVAPALGDAAALVERFEFQPMEDPDPDFDPDVPGPEAAEPKAPTVPKPPAPPKPPTPPAIVVDVPRIMEQAQRAAKAQSAASPEAAPFIDYGFKVGRSAVEAGMKAAAEALAASRIDAAAAHEMQMQVEGRRVEIAVKKHGKLLGKANATLNLDRTLGTVLQLARRDQGEIPFAIDRRGGLYTPEASQKPLLQSIAIDRQAKLAASGRPRRVGEWLIVAREAGSGLTFGIARPMGAPLREIRRASVRTLSLGLLVIGLALIGIVPISHRMTRHLTSLTHGVKQLAGGDFRARVQSIDR